MNIQWTEDGKKRRKKHCCWVFEVPCVWWKLCVQSTVDHVVYLQWDGDTMAVKANNSSITHNSANMRGGKRTNIYKHHPHIYFRRRCTSTKDSLLSLSYTNALTSLYLPTIPCISPVRLCLLCLRCVSPNWMTFDPKIQTWCWYTLFSLLLVCILLFFYFV